MPERVKRGSGAARVMTPELLIDALRFQGRYAAESESAAAERRVAERFAAAFEIERLLKLLPQR